MDNQTTDSQATPDSGQQPATARPIIKIDPANVPPELHHLIPYAEKWGISDDETLTNLLNEASVPELEELYAVVSPILEDIVKAMNFPPLQDTPEARVFVALMMAAGGAAANRRSLREHDQTFHKHVDLWDTPLEKLDKAWLKKIGWPEKYPPLQLDPAKFPSELHTIIPYAEKWVIDDDVIRSVVLQESPDEELEDFLRAVNEIGMNSIRRLALKMTHDETRKAEGFVLLIMLEQAEHAEYWLRIRRRATPNDDGVDPTQST